MKKTLIGLLAVALSLTAFSCNSPVASIGKTTEPVFETARFDNIIDYRYYISRKDNGKTVCIRATRGNDEDPNWVYLYFIRTFQLEDALKELKNIALWIEDGRINPYAPINYYKEDHAHYDKLCISKGTYTVRAEYIW